MPKIKSRACKGLILRQLGHAENCSAPAAFRPLLTEGLALSGLSFLNFFLREAFNSILGVNIWMRIQIV